MNAPLDDLYIEWLYSQVASVTVRSRSKTYWNLMRQLYKKEFTWSVPNDDNRVEDGRDLRYQFLNACHISGVDEDWLRMPCSMLELLIGLAYRLEFEADGSVQMWFWKLLENLELDQFTDALYKEAVDAYVDSVLNTVIERTYDRNGRGGIFPLERRCRDQRKVELWYQLCSYLLENG